MPRKRVLITLPPDAYRRLAEMADDEERVIDQQASLLLKRLLTAATPSVVGTTRCDEPPASGSGLDRDGSVV